MLSLERQESYRRRYAAENPGWRPATHVYRDRVAATLDSAARVLDLGCGRGGILEELAPRAALSVGLDPDWDSLEEHRSLTLPRTCGQAQVLPFPDETFDLVSCSWVLEHLAAPKQAFAEVSRVLVPGGRFIFLTPNRRHPLLVFNRLLGWTGGRWVSRFYDRTEADTFPAVYRANAPSHIRGLLQAAGLAVNDLVPVGDPTYLAFNEPLYRAACLLERFIPPALRVHLIGEASKGPRSTAR